MIDAYERVLGADPAVGQLYESNYLKANSPQGDRAVWIKHTVLRRAQGPSVLEIWLVLYERGVPPIVAKREVPLEQALLGAQQLSVQAGSVVLEPDRASGSIADLGWSLTLSGGFGPVHHLPYAWMYRGPFPRAKILTARSNTRFDGQIQAGTVQWAVADWVGIRGHNWGPAHTHTYAYGNCNLWADGSRHRTVEGIAAKVALGPVITPWLTAVVGCAPRVRRNRPRDWWRASTVGPEGWTARFGRGLRTPATLRMEARPEQYAGLRYLHPDGARSYCYNTKFARVQWQVGQAIHRSDCGELEVLFPEPLPAVSLHPHAGWTQADGDYRSG